MVDSLPKFLNYDQVVSFDPEEFYCDKVVPFRDIVENSPQYTNSMVNGILDEKVDGDIRELDRMRIVLTGSRSNSRKSDYSVLESALEDNIDEFFDEPIDFSSWYNEFINNVVPFSKSKEFRNYSMREKPPAEYEDSFEPVEALAEAAVEYFKDNRINILGSSHYVIEINQSQFKDKFGVVPSRPAQEGYIGREGRNSNMRVFINNELVKRMTSTEIDSNPYTL